MKLSRIQEWPRPSDFTSFVDVNLWAKKLTMSLEENAALQLEELTLPNTNNYNIILGVGAAENSNINVDAGEGTYNVFIGHEAGYTNDTGAKNIGLGYRAMYLNTTGGENIALGSEALYSNTTGGNNVAIGNDALYSCTEGDGNLAFGYHAGYSITTGSENTAIGDYAFDANTKGSANVAIGWGALGGFNQTSDLSTYNVAVGAASQLAATTGKHNTSVGGYSIPGAVTGDENCALGYKSLYTNTSGANNIAIGSEAGYSNSTGDGNIFIGYQAGYSETASNKLYIANSNTATPLIGGVFPNTSLAFKATTVTLGATPALILGDGSITDSSGAISFGNENLSTTGTLASGNLTVTGIQYINDSANTKMTQGLTINQGGNDDEIIAFKSSDVAHGYTDIMETDSYASFQKSSATLGGLNITALYEDAAGLPALKLTAHGGTATTNKDTSARGLIELYISEHDGANAIADVTADGNIFVIRARVSSSSVARWLVDEDGDTWQNGMVSADTAATGGAANVYHAGTGNFLRYASSKKYKDKIKDLELDSLLIYKLRPVSYNSLCEFDDKDKRFHGLVTEEIERHIPEIIIYDKNNEAESYDTQMLATLMLKEIQGLNQRILQLEST